MLDKFGELLYSKIFVNIVLDHNYTIVYIEKVRKSIVVESEEKKFKVIGLDSQMVDFIESYTKDSPYYYISILDQSTYQGATPSCMHSEMDKFYDRSISVDKCYDNKWAFYTSKFDLDDLQRNYRKIGLDFVFSPFVVLAKFFKDKVENDLSMFILIQESFITLSIYDKAQLLYAEHFDIQKDAEEELSLDEEHRRHEEIDLGEDDSIDLEDVDVDDDLDDLDGFGDIEDLDSIEEIDEFSDVNDDIEDEDKKEEFGEALHNITEDFNEDYQRFLSIQDAVKRFYEDEKFNSQFIESVYIADSVGVSDDLKNYLEEEMFLSVYIRRILIGAQVSDLAQMELK